MNEVNRLLELPTYLPVQLLCMLMTVKCIGLLISTQEDLSTFQSDIDKISDWCKMNKMRINTKKCKIMRITRKKSPLVGEYNIEGQPLESVDVYKDLGLFTTSNLSWNQHVDKM